jgi:hypothetical protein
MCRLRVGVSKTPLRWKPHDIRDSCSDWIEEETAWLTQDLNKRWMV